MGFLPSIGAQGGDNIAYMLKFVFIYKLALFGYIVQMGC